VREGLVEIDGSHGEGGGQILRTSLALSIVTRRPLRMRRIRAGRKRPGLQRQHLACVEAAARLCYGHVDGAEIGSQELDFTPGEGSARELTIDIGTAGSTTLVVQTILVPALTLGHELTATVIGGTHNPLAPPFEFLARAFLPLVARMGPRATAVLERPGFFPAGGGRFRVEIEPAAAFGRLELLERGELRERRATAVIALLPRSIAERELRVVREKLGWDPAWTRIEHLQDAIGPGNVVTVELASEHVTEVFTGFGERGVSAERVGATVAAEAAEYLAAGVPVGRHLADQLLLPMALGAGGSFRTLAPSSHTRTHADLLRAFLGTVVQLREVGEREWELEVPARR
jgi:RNA 3'-terminal phosphate cyclase (ATP)